MYRYIIYHWLDFIYLSRTDRRIDCYFFFKLSVFKTDAKSMYRVFKFLAVSLLTVRYIHTCFYRPLYNEYRVVSSESGLYFVILKQIKSIWFLFTSDLWLHFRLLQKFKISKNFELVPWLEFRIFESDV